MAWYIPLRVSRQVLHGMKVHMHSDVAAGEPYLIVRRKNVHLFNWGPAKRIVFMTIEQSLNDLRGLQCVTVACR